MIWLLLSHEATGSPWQEPFLASEGPKSLSDTPGYVAESHIAKVESSKPERIKTGELPSRGTFLLSAVQ